MVEFTPTWWQNTTQGGMTVHTCSRTETHIQHGIHKPSQTCMYLHKTENSIFC